MGRLLTQRDSADIVIVENRHQPDAIPLYARLDPAPLARIGVAAGDPEQEFGRISRALLLSEDRILIADGQAHQLSLFSFDGDRLWSFGREGEGPGEFHSLGQVELGPGDTVAVWDRRNRRLTLADSRSDGFRDFFLTTEEHGDPASVEALPNGGYLGGFHREADGVEKGGGLLLRTDSVLLALLEESGRVEAVFGPFLGGESLTRTQSGGEMMLFLQMSLPFSRSLSWDVHGDELFVGENGTFEIEVFGLDGRLRRLLRVPALSRPLTEEDIQGLKEERYAGTDGSPEARERVAERIDDAPKPELRPAFSTLTVDEGGRLWVKEYRPRPGQEITWWVFSSHGELLGSVHLPPDTDVHHIGDGLILLQPPHELDVPMLQVHRLIRAGDR